MPFSSMKRQMYLSLAVSLIASFVLLPLKALFAQTGTSPTPPDELRNLILQQFELNQSTVPDALTKWKEASLAAAGGEGKIFASIRNAASELRDVRLTLSLAQVSAIDAMEALVSAINEQAEDAKVVLSGWSHVTGRMTAVYYVVEDVPEGLARARRIMLPAFQIRGQEFLKAVEAWSKLVDRHDPDRDGISWTATNIRDRLSFGGKFDLDIPATDAATAIEQICQAANAKAEWGVTDFVDGAMREFDLKLMLFEAKPELRQDHDWTNADGTKTIQARFVKLGQGRVTLLLKANNQTVEVPMESLSTESQQQAEKLAKLGK